MANCFVTKLKGVVNNPSLIKIDEFVFHISRSTREGVTEWNRIELVGSNISVRTLDGSNRLKCEALGYTSFTDSIVAPSGTNVVNLVLDATANYDIAIGNRELMTEFNVAGMNYAVGITFDLNNFVKCFTNLGVFTPRYVQTFTEDYTLASDSLYYLSLGYSNIKANVSNLTFPNMTDFFPSSEMYGTISTIAQRFPKLKKLEFSTNLKIAGTIESFCENLTGNDRTINIPKVRNTEMTFHNTFLDKYKIIKQTGTVMVYDNSDNLLGTWNGTSWSYSS